MADSHIERDNTDTSHNAHLPGDAINGKARVANDRLVAVADNTPPVRRGLINLALLATVAAFAVALVAQPEQPATHPSSPRSSSMDHGDRIPDTGWATDPIDQPTAVPGWDWVGWANQARGRCAWLTAGLLTRVRAVGAPADDGRACRIPVTNGDYLRVVWGRARYPMWWDPLRRERAGTVGGLQARIIDLVLSRVRYPGACQVSVHTRGLSDLAVIAWNRAGPSATPTAPRCALAQRAAEMIVRTRVPATGGTVWSRTPQAPSSAALDSLTPCELLTAAVDNYVPVTSSTEHDTSNGRACTLASINTRVSVLVTRGAHHGLARMPAHDDTARITRLSLGQLPARTEQTTDGCAAAAEVAPGRSIRIRYANARAGNRTCPIATMLLERAVQHLLDRSSS